MDEYAKYVTQQGLKIRVYNRDRVMGEKPKSSIHDWDWMEFMERNRTEEPVPWKIYPDEHQQGHDVALARPRKGPNLRGDR